MKILSNDKITVQITDHGAELASIMANGNEYLWQGDIRFWGRRSPVLFPIVGRLWNNQYHHEGETYELGQHGFARDCEFQLTYEEENSLVFSLESNEDTLKLYPFPFILQIGYRLRDNRLQVIWNVENTGDREMHFQIGGHPAFYYRDLDLNTKQRGFLDFGQKHLLLHYLTPAEKGCVKPEHQELRLPDGIMELTSDSFGCDTYIFDNSQLRKMTLLDRNRKPYLSLEFNTPLAAVWSPSAVHPDVPFVCLEPWYGRCDTVGYRGELKDREWIQHLVPGKSFTGGYTIVLEDL